jgi:hypothetical protein
MEEGLYEGLGEVIYWSITPMGRYTLRHLHTDQPLIRFILGKLGERTTSTMELYSTVSTYQGRYTTVLSFLRDLHLLEKAGWIEREIRWED